MLLVLHVESALASVDRRNHTCKISVSWLKRAKNGHHFPDVELVNQVSRDVVHIVDHPADGAARQIHSVDSEGQMCRAFRGAAGVVQPIVQLKFVVLVSLHVRLQVVRVDVLSVQESHDCLEHLLSVTHVSLNVGLPRNRVKVQVFERFSDNLWLNHSSTFFFLRIKFIPVEKFAQSTEDTDLTLHDSSFLLSLFLLPPFIFLQCSFQENRIQFLIMLLKHLLRRLPLQTHGITRLSLDHFKVLCWSSASVHNSRKLCLFFRTRLFSDSKVYQIVLDCRIHTGTQTPVVFILLGLQNVEGNGA